MKDLSTIREEVLGLQKKTLNEALARRVIFDLDEIDIEKPALYLQGEAASFYHILREFVQNMDHFNSIQIIILTSKEAKERLAIVHSNCIEYPHHCCIAFSSDFNSSLANIFDSYERAEEPFNTIHITDGSWDIVSETDFFGQNEKHIYSTDYTEMGCQLHLMSGNHITALEENYFEYYRLGSIKSNRSDWEPLMRNQHICLFDTNAIKISDLPGKANANPSGFTSEEAIQLLRYAMISPKMSFVVFYNLEQGNHIDEVSKTWASQALWYSLQGIESRTYEKPFSSENLVEMVMDNEVLEHPISFLKSKKTGRWWVKIPTPSTSKTEYYYFPCSENDYQRSRESHLPKRIVRAIYRAQNQ